MIRDCEPDIANPLPANIVRDLIEKRYGGRVLTMVIPDIWSVNYGRGVGYEINELEPPPEIHGISGSEIRRQIAQEDHEWKYHVDPSLWADVEELYG